MDHYWLESSIHSQTSQFMDRVWLVHVAASGVAGPLTLSHFFDIMMVCALPPQGPSPMSRIPLSPSPSISVSSSLSLSLSFASPAPSHCSRQIAAWVTEGAGCWMGPAAGQAAAKAGSHSWAALAA
eukprot:1586364-Rhodomonas_salina.2